MLMPLDEQIEPTEAPDEPTAPSWLDSPHVGLRGPHLSANTPILSSVCPERLLHSDKLECIQCTSKSICYKACR